MNSITIRDRILAHLYKYRRYSMDSFEGSPMEITQEGIGAALGITRSHACVVLNRMIENQEVEIYMSTVKGSKRMIKRKIYHITELGKREYARRLEELRQSGIDLETIGKEINECNFDEISRMPRDRLDDIGCLVVLRTTVHREEVGDRTAMIPFRSDGTLNLKPYVIESMFRLGKEDDLRKWHSKAADWCMDHDRPDEERIYHLINSNRDWEAMRLVRKNKFRLMDSDDTDLSRSVSVLSKRHTDTDVMVIGARMALNNDLLDEAESLCAAISNHDPALGHRLMSEVLVRRDRCEEALVLARSSCGDGPDSGITMGLCLLRSNRLKEARECFEDARARLVESGCLYRLDELLLYEATVELNLDNRECAERLIRTGLSISQNKRLKDSLSELDGRILRTRCCS